MYQFVFFQRETISTVIINLNVIVINYVTIKALMKLRQNYSYNLMENKRKLKSTCIHDN
jgi:hypothetical protein